MGTYTVRRGDTLSGIALLERSAAADIGRALGLAWGGDWKRFPDLPHFEYCGGLTLDTSRTLVPRGLAAVWAAVE